MGYTVSPELGLKLFDPATIQAFEPVEVNANLMKLENGIKADRVSLAGDDVRLDAIDLAITALQSVTVDNDVTDWFDIDPGWTMNTAIASYSATAVTLRLDLTKKTPAIVSTADGNLSTNNTIATIKASVARFRPSTQAPLMTTSVGVWVGAYVNTSGDILINNVTVQQGIPVGYQIVIAGTWVRQAGA